MKVVICGSRDFTDREAMFRWLDRFHAQHQVTLVVEGGQRKWDREARRYVGGADFFAHEWAVTRGIQVETVKADWDDLSAPGQQKMGVNGKRFNSAAGPRRNKRMATEFGATHCLSFGGGRGTASMEVEAELAGLALIDVTPEMLREVMA